MKVYIYVCCFLTAICTTAFASLNTIEMAYYAVDAGGQESVVHNSYAYNGANGVMVMNTRNPIGPLSNLIGNHIWTYCYDVGTYSSFSYATFDVSMLQDAIGQDKGDLISQLWALHYNHAWQADTYIYYGGSYGGFVSGQPADTTENEQALAFSEAVYEIVYDYSGTISSLNLSSGSFTVNAGSTCPSSAVSIAQGWLNSLVLPSQYSGPKAELVSLADSSLQNVIVEIPEPATMAILSFAVFAYFRREIKNKI